MKIKELLPLKVYPITLMLSFSGQNEVLSGSISDTFVHFGPNDVRL